MRALTAPLLLAVTLQAQAQTQSPPAPAAAPPRVGLALSGGGARGAAHIGVLKVLEALRVPVSCVAGTSMGAVVGGAFAAGTRPQDMEELIASTDWSSVFSDRPPRAEIPARRKADDYKALFAAEFTWRNGSLALPAGVAGGLTIDGFLRKLAAPADNEDDFSQLPIPFSAVAADITTGQPVVLRSGSLARAMRASMAVPGALAPVEIDQRILVDGGIANNLPIDLVRACSDVVIAVNISTPPFAREEITSVVSVMGQLVNLLGKETVDRQLASLGPADVLITPRLGDIAASSFDRQAEAVALGYAAAIGVSESLRRYSVSEAEYQALARRRSPVPHALASVDAVVLEGLPEASRAAMMPLIAARPGAPISEASLAADLRRLNDAGPFDELDYRIEQRGAARTLVFRAREAADGVPRVRFGLSLSADFRGDSAFNALLSVRRPRLNALGGELLAEAQVGNTNQVGAEFYQPLTAARDFFVAPSARVSRKRLGIYAEDLRVAEYQVRETRYGLDAGMALGSWGELRVGQQLRRIAARVETGLPLYPSLDLTTHARRIALSGDTLDNPWFPRSGHRVSVDALLAGRSSGTVDSYRRLELSWTGAASAGAHTVAASVLLGSDLGTELPVHEAFALGGPLRLSAYRPSQFLGSGMAFAGVRYHHRLQRLPSYLGSGLYWGATVEAGRVKDELADGRTTGLLWSTSLFLGAETVLGPGLLGLGVGPDGKRRLFLFLGVPF